MRPSPIAASTARATRKPWPPSTWRSTAAAPSAANSAAPTAPASSRSGAPGRRRLCRRGGRGDRLPCLAEEAQARARRLEGLLAQLRGGVAAYDRQRCVLFNNPAYEDLLGLPPGALRPGTSYETLFEMLSERGEFANTDAAAVIDDRRRIDRTRPATYQRIRPNGQALRIESQPLPDGGYLVELNDISRGEAGRGRGAAPRRAARRRARLAAAWRRRLWRGWPRRHGQRGAPGDHGRGRAGGRRAPRDITAAAPSRASTARRRRGEGGR